MSRSQTKWVFTITVVILTFLIFFGPFLPRTGEYEPLYFGWMPFWLMRLLVVMVLYMIWTVALWLWDARDE